MFQLNWTIFIVKYKHLNETQDDSKDILAFFFFSK